MDQAYIDRFRELRALEEKVRMSLLGHPVEDRRKLEKLHARVKKELISLRTEMRAQLESESGK